MIVVTGGLGFIGNELIRQLLAAGYPVSVVDNKNRIAPKIEDIVQKTDVHLADITDFATVEALFHELKPEVVIHLAAIHFIPECNENPERTLRVNVEGTSVVIRAARKAGAKRLLFASSGAVYGDVPDILKEESLISPVDVYGYSKLFGEGLCRLYASSNFEIVACRLFNNYGPRETNPHIIPEILQQLAKGATTLQLGNIKPIRDYIHTTDTALAIINLINTDLPGMFTPLNLCTGKGHSVENLIDLIKEIINTDIIVEKDPKRFRKVDKMIQIGSFERLFGITGWEPRWQMKEGMKNLLEFENFSCR